MKTSEVKQAAASMASVQTNLCVNVVCQPNSRAGCVGKLHAPNR
jgi:hypothetical protein